ncbi:MAG: ABC transporter substrate-binding protein [Candidatus Hodarchaeota archaeon]
MKKNNKNLIIALTILLSFNLYLFATNIDLNEQNNNEIIKTKPHNSIIVGSYTVPGISGPISINEVLKIGILCDLYHLTGDQIWNGALLAAKEINEVGGVLINSSTYYIGLVAEDTDEMSGTLDIAYTIYAATQLLTYNPDFVLGGTRTEALLAYQEVIMDAQIPFLCTGCADDVFCENVITYYARYKYFFRVMPINGTSLAKELFSYTLYLVNYLNSTYGAPTLNIGIIHEDLPWSFPLTNALETYLPILNPSINIVGNIPVPITVTASQMNSFLNALDAANAQVVIPLFSSPIGILMSQEYGVLQPGYLLAGINSFSQIDTFWDQSSGGCRYEIIMDTIHNTPITSLTLPFWNDYIWEYGIEPYYTGVGSYNAIKLLENATIETQSFNSDTIVTHLETINISNYFPGVSGNLAFTPSHDLVEGWPFATALFAQWQMDGKKVVVSSGGTIYPDYLATGTLTIPHWGINNLVASYSHLLPGDFILDSDADDPDPNGTFNLNWTNSNGADNYSLYMAYEPITYVSKIYTELAKQNAISPFPVSGLFIGDYYFVCVAYNETGQKFSNILHVVVQLPSYPPGNFTLSSDADDPDPNGNYHLIWTPAEGADSYSVYASVNYITEIGLGVVNLAYRTAVSPYPISVFSSGDYYYVVVAHNLTGTTLSNCVRITVLLAGEPVPEIPGYNWVLLYGLASLISLILINKYNRRLKN